MESNPQVVSATAAALALRFHPWQASLRGRHRESLSSLSRYQQFMFPATFEVIVHLPPLPSVPGFWRRILWPSGSLHLGLDLRGVLHLSAVVPSTRFYPSSCLESQYPGSLYEVWGVLCA